MTVLRNDLCSSGSHAAPESLLRLLHLSDAHVMDTLSPARAEWVELLAQDPHWRPLLHMHRPYEALIMHALIAHVNKINNAPICPSNGLPFDLVVSTGDNIDNAQRNELDAYLAAMGGGCAQLDARCGAIDPRSGALSGVWPFWDPAGGHQNAWRAAGYPSLDNLVDRASEPVRSPGWGVPWTSIAGNHDLLRQGTAITNTALERIAVGASKSLSRPEDFAPNNPLRAFLDTPEKFSDGPGYTIIPHSGRRVIERQEWANAHADAGALGYRIERAEGQIANLDRVIDLDHARLILLDTNHPHGDYQGSIGTSQLAWLDDRLTEVDQVPGRLAVLISHHGAQTLTNERGADPERRHAASLTAVAHRHRSVVAWLVGHRHINRVTPHPGASGGFWEITTASIVDWPSQTRAIDISRGTNGSVEISCTMLDHDAHVDSLANAHRDLARRFAGDAAARSMSGQPEDRDVRLPVR